MRTLTLLVFFGCSTLWSQAQAPPKSPQVPKQKSAKGTASNEKSSNRKQAANDIASARPENEIEATSEETAAAAEARKELETNRKLADYTGQLAMFTRYLVVVGALQFLALIGQGLIFWNTLKENRKLISAASTSANAARDGALAAVESNNLTRDSIGEARRSNVAHEELVKESNALTRDSNTSTQQANELTRKSFILSHRPKLLVRNVVVRAPEGKQDIASIAQRLADGVVNNVPPGELYVLNSGETDARITRMHCEILDGDRLPMVPPYAGKAGVGMNITVAPGVIRLVPFPSETYIRQHSVQRVEQGWEKFWTLGWIEYVDGEGNVRTTLFCRQWSNLTLKFFPVDDTDYERAD